ncbi:MAG TPA: phosphatase PAP2 family protein [Micropepsaceae bacterium]|nr:phosphatase PAP2 family protein [Micropepsaceae bacterium]
MLIGVAVVLLLLGLAALTIDRGAAQYFRQHIETPLFKFAYHVTDFAKGGPWIALAALAYVGTQVWIMTASSSPVIAAISDYALALLASFVAGSVVLHVLKIFLGRRRPRDDVEHGLYGFRYFTWQLQYDSFPSGHAMTIFSVAVLASIIVPKLAPLWFGIALSLSVTRAMLIAHFLSDVLIGAALGILATRETLIYVFPALAPGWL